MLAIVGDDENLVLEKNWFSFNSTFFILKHHGFSLNNETTFI